MVRNDLEPGLQLSQSVHAAVQFVFENPEISLNWYNIYNYIVVLQISSEQELNDLIIVAHGKEIKHAIYREPDVENQVTAVSFEPGNKSKKLCRHLKLALSDYG